MKYLNICVAVLAVFCFGCMSDSVQQKDDRALFNKVSSKLEKGGSYFSFQSNKYIFRAVETTYLAIPGALKVIVSNPKQQMMPLKVYNSLKPIVQSLGVHEILGGGASSILIAEKTATSPALFRSRQFVYYGDTKPQGLIWDFMAGENHKLSHLEDLPKETLFACSIESTTGKIWSKVKKIFATLPLPPAQMMPMMAEQKFYNQFQITLPDFLDSLSGTCSSIIVEAKTANGKPAIYAMLKIPNKKNITFKVLSKIAQSNPHIQVTANEIKSRTALPLNWIKPVARRDENNMYIMSNPKILEIIKNTTDNNNGLITSPHFKRLSQNLPQKGIAFAYFNSKTLKVIIDVISAHAPVPKKDWSILAKLIPPSDIFLVVSKEEDGIMTTMNSPMDIPVIITYSSLIPSIVQATTLLPALNSSRRKARQISCMSNLKQIGLAMKMYAMDHKDKYPAGNNAIGLNHLIKEDYLVDMRIYICPNAAKGKIPNIITKKLNEKNCSYIYFGDFIEGDGYNIPVAFDKFSNNKGLINILYQDGHVQSMRHKFKNCKNLIAHLARTNKYKPAILKKLQAKAMQIDKELGYK